MKKLIVNQVYWVGINGKTLNHMRGYEYSKRFNPSYNSYLIVEEKTVLIDTVIRPFSLEFIENLSKEGELSKIDYIIINHAEPEHSGALPELMSIIPSTPIYCTEYGIKFLKGYYHQNWNFKTVKTGDKLSIGNSKELIFIVVQSLHWPEAMFCYLTGDNILFSNVAFMSDTIHDLVNQNELCFEKINYIQMRFSY